MATGALVVSLIAVLLLGASGAVLGLIWGALGAVALVDAVLSLATSRSVAAEVPPEVFVGEDAAITLEVSNPPPAMTGRIDWPEGLSGPEDFAFVEGRAEVPAHAVRRGAWEISKLWLRWQSRLGLFDCVPVLPLSATVRVVPNVRLVQSGEIATTVQSTLYGIKENRALGEGSEFHQMREFVAGMDTRSIDWKRSARHRGLMAKELQAERNHHVILALDNGYLMGEPIAGLPRIDHAVTAALATAWAAALGGDQVGLFTYDVRPRVFMAPEPGRAAFARLRARTAELTYVAQETNHTLGLSALNARTPKRSLIIVFTDFVDTTSAELLLENIAVLVRRHVVIFVTLRDPELHRLTSHAPGDMDGVATLVAGHQALSERRLVLERLARLGVSVIDTEPGQLTAQLISKYVEIKAKELV